MFSKKYGEKVASILQEFGEDGLKLAEKYGDDLARIIDNLESTEAKKAVSLINSYGDDALEMFKEGKSFDEVKKVVEGEGKVISQADRAKIDAWNNTPSDELYLKYKDVFDNPRYYNQETGAINWTEKNEFADIPMDEVLQPGTDQRPYSVFEVVEPIDVKSGSIASWFDEPGGGIQYLLPDTVDELLDAGILRRIQ